MRILKSLFIIIIGGMGFFISEASANPTNPLQLRATTYKSNFSAEYSFMKKDSVEKALKRKINRNARIAAACSAIIPGAGQIYNKKWWKVPIIYAAAGGVGYLFLQNDIQYQSYKKEIIYRVENPNMVNEYANYSIDNLVTQKNYYRKYRDLTVMGLSLIYVLNILDAYVDGHLKKFDMSDDLSLRIKPYENIYYTTKPNLTVGLTFQITFK